MAHLVRPWIVSYVDAAGRRVPKGTRGAKKVRTKASKWYAQGIPGYPPKKRVPLSRDKSVARSMMAELVARALRGQTGLPDPGAGRTPLADHLERFRADLAIGMATRPGKSKRPLSDDQTVLVVQRVRDVLAGCRFAHVADLNDAAPGKLAGYLQGRVKVPTAEGGCSHQTAAYLLSCTRRFVWWLSARAKAPVRADLFDDVPAFDVTNNRVHLRRDVTPEEMARLLDAARAGPPYRGLTGEDRYHLYLTAFATGYRAGELAVLTPAAFDLDGGIVTLSARQTKNKKAARQPLPPGVVYQLRPYLSDKPAGRPVWAGTWAKDPIEILRRDLAAAGIPYKVESAEGPRFADFHALRHSYLSSLAAAGVGVKELQELARHSDVRLTLGVYTHTRPEALASSVARLQLPGAADPNPLAAMTREDLERVLVGVTALLASLLAPPLAPAVAAPGDDVRQPDTRKGAKAAAKNGQKGPEKT